MRASLRWASVLGAATLALAGCGSSGTSGSTTAGNTPPAPPKLAMQSAVGAGEGTLNLIAWAGYAENGSTDKKVDWVTPFQAQSGCKVNVKIGNTSDEMVALMKTGQYDGVSASGDATLRLIYGGDVAPVNTSLVPNYATISDFLKDRPWNSVGGQMYGIPHGWGANVLMWNPKVVTTAPTSWGAVFDPSSPYQGKITAYDSPIYIADAALYLKATRPELKITNPYELDATQFQAAVELLKAQRKLVGEYWSSYTTEVSSFGAGNSVIGTAWQVNANLINGEGKVKVETAVPSEGATGWSDTWLVGAKAAHPNCMYRWLDWITSPSVNAQVAEWFGEAPAQTKACDRTADETFCTTFHALDQDYAGKISYWTTPTKSCGDGRGNACEDYAAWTQAWTQIKG
ncbi:MAG: ABC transporter substrate-binding protein [Actinobacteria bacterium]|nr:ABC transporter substrate-binding protein [Actinomycetota bacterium]MBI3688427.1 ABC transporter substrate-binding protein [Actinomycetota bacterium]